MCLGDWRKCVPLHLQVPICLSAVHYLQSNSQLSIMPPTHQTEQTFGHLDTWGNKTAAVSCHPQKPPSPSPFGKALWNRSKKEMNHTQAGFSAHLFGISALHSWRWPHALGHWGPVLLDDLRRTRLGALLTQLLFDTLRHLEQCSPKNVWTCLKNLGIHDSRSWFINYSSDPFQRTSTLTDAQPSSSACAWLNKLNTLCKFGDTPWTSPTTNAPILIMQTLTMLSTPLALLFHGHPLQQVAKNRAITATACGPCGAGLCL